MEKFVLPPYSLPIQPLSTCRRSCSLRGHSDPLNPALELAPSPLPARRISVTRPLARYGASRAALDLLRAPDRRQAQRKDGAFVRFTLHHQAAAQEFGESATEGEAEAGATVLFVVVVASA